MEHIKLNKLKKLLKNKCCVYVKSIRLMLYDKAQWKL